MKTLLHICCAPCAVQCVKTLRDESIETVGFWYNPNIHPFTEYRSRKECLIEYARQIDMELALNDEYGLREFVRGVSADLNNRCPFCYRIRLEAAAKHAAEHGFDSFTTTLLISPYQDHDLIITAAQQAAAEYGTMFLYRDFRPYFREGQKEARSLGLYMQKYCGCVFSEEERYCKSARHSKSK